ncbi:MAG TPA: hypothetical protein VIJ16_06020 [Gemmatimonadaceae bacterium]
MRLVIAPLSAVLAAAALVLVAPRAAHAQAGSGPAAAKPDSAHPTVRVRLIGVFDEQSGDPIENADIRDMISGFTVRTTKTGTAALFLMDTTGTVLTIKKLGYHQAIAAITTAYTDTTPITTTLLRMGESLAPVIIAGDRAIRLGKNDTISTLLKNGFYERREMGAAPRTAFVSGDKLQGLMLATDARFFGRGICESNVYIDGMRIAAPHRTGRFLNEGIDQLVQPSDIAGIETYTFGEMPENVAHTVDGAGSMDGSTGAGLAANSVLSAAGTLAGTGCVSLIWLRN